jgi:hypothetical protein
MTLFSLVTVYLIGGFGIFYVLLLHGPHCSCGYSLPIDRPKTGDW